MTGWTLGEGGFRMRPDRDEGCLLQLNVTFPANALAILAASPHDGYLALQAQLQSRFAATLRPLVYLHTKRRSSSVTEAT